MLRRSLLMVSLLIAIVVSAAPKAVHGAGTVSVSVTDATGQTLTLKESPRRIVSLSPHAAELMFAAGGGDRLVATTSYSDYPAAAKAVPRIGGYNSIAVESIVALKPDLLLIWPTGNPEALIEKLRDFDIPVYHSEPRSVGDIAKDLRNFGRLVGSDQGEKAADGLLKGWDDLKKQYGSLTTVPIFLEVASKPLMTLNGEHMVSQLFAVCGAKNIFADAPVLVPRISREAVVARMPEVIVEGDGGDRIGSDLLYREWQEFSTIPAVRNRMVFTLDGGHLLRPTPRMLIGARALCKKVEQARTLMGQKRIE